jgi:hypothetical protein
MARPARRSLRRHARLALAVAASLALAACNVGAGPGGQPPSLSDVADQTTTLGEPVAVDLALTDEAPATVKVTASSSNEQVVSSSGLAVSGAGTSRTLTVTPGSTTTGTAVITVTATDEGGKSSSVDFEVTVERPFAGAPAILTPQNADPIGVSVAIDGDVAVAGGAEYAYVFELDGGDWVERKKLTSDINGIVVVEAFGVDVAVEGDRVLVGAPDSDGSATDQGTAFLFARSGDDFAFDGELLDPAPEQSDRMSRSVGLSGDVLFAGAPGATENSVASGSVVMFQPSGLGGWELLGKLTPSDAVDGTVFGEALDVSGDLLVVGDYGNDQRGVDAGAAYVFEAEAGFWNEVAKLAPAELEAGDQFGLGVAADDGWVLVGSWNDDDAGQEAGAVYVFHDAGSGWQLVDKLLASDAAPFASFGGSLALDYPYAVVGAHYEDSAADNAGAVYVLRHDGTTWHEVAKLTSPHAAAGGGFGFDVDVSGEHLIVSQLQSPTFTAVYRR